MIIDGLDHIELMVASPKAVAANYAAMLDRPTPPYADGQSEGPFRLQCENIGLVVRAASSQQIGPDAGPLPRLAFASSDIAAAKHRLLRRGLSGSMQSERLDLDPAATHGVPISLTASRGVASHRAEVDIVGLDHVVIRTPDPERAVALYGGRLGLDLRLDRSIPEIGSRMLFFVCGDLVLEFIHDANKGVGGGPDRIWGLAWRANDLEAAHARLLSRNIAVSEIREGRRPETRVFTVKSHVGDIPTLVIGGSGLKRA